MLDYASGKTLCILLHCIYLWHPFLRSTQVILTCFPFNDKVFLNRLNWNMNLNYKYQQYAQKNMVPVIFYYLIVFILEFIFKQYIDTWTGMNLTNLQNWTYIVATHFQDFRYECHYTKTTFAYFEALLTPIDSQYTHWF